MQKNAENCIKKCIYFLDLLKIKMEKKNSRMKVI